MLCHYQVWAGGEKPQMLNAPLSSLTPKEDRKLSVFVGRNLVFFRGGCYCNVLHFFWLYILWNELCQPISESIFFRDISFNFHTFVASVFDTYLLKTLVNLEIGIKLKFAPLSSFGLYIIGLSSKICTLSRVTYTYITDISKQTDETNYLNKLDHFVFSLRQIGHLPWPDRFWHKRSIIWMKFVCCGNIISFHFFRPPSSCQFHSSVTSPGTQSSPLLCYCLTRTASWYQSRKIYSTILHTGKKSQFHRVDILNENFAVETLVIQVNYFFRKFLLFTILSKNLKGNSIYRYCCA